MDRRNFLRTAGGGSLAMILGAVAESVARAGEVAWVGTPFARDPLAGSCLLPLGDVERTLGAMLDTVVPGPTTDPEGTAGALEACSMNILLDGSFPFRQYADMFALVLDGIATDAHGAAFADLPYDQRLQVLVTAQDQLPMLRLAFRAIRSAFFGGAYNGIGLRYVGYPGPNLGWRHVPESSFRVAVCEERTQTGWMP
jgi:hypothetical protein